MATNPYAEKVFLERLIERNQLLSGLSKPREAVAGGCAAFDDIARWGYAPQQVAAPVKDERGNLFEVNNLFEIALDQVDRINTKDVRIAALEAENATLRGESRSGGNTFIGRGESPPQHNVARYWCERAQRAEQALATASAKETPDMWAMYLAEKRRVETLESVIRSYENRIGELESYSQAAAVSIDERNAKDQETEAYQYLKRLFLHLAPQCCVLPDLLGVCTQIDNAIVGLLNQPPDLPAAPTRPDGTQAPEPRPWGPPKQTTDRRLIGG